MTVPEPAMSEQSSTGAPPFHVLLGPDRAGKSSVLRRLAAEEPDWCVASVDGAFVAPEHSVIGTLKRVLVADTLPGLGSAFSGDFVVSLLQTAVVHLRDRVLAARPGTPVVVDSYYYKVLAKCRLVGADDHPVFAWWRSFPQPHEVLYLDVAPSVAWARCRAGAEANRLEHYGEHPDRHGFESFQADLAKVMLDEVRDLPVTWLPERDTVAASVRDLRRAVSRARL